MFKRFAFFCVLTFLFSCQNEQSSTNYTVIEKDTVAVKLAALELDTNSLETNEKQTFYYIEDFVKLNTRSKLKKAFEKSAIFDTVAYYAEGTVKLNISKLHLNNGNTLRFVWDQNNDEQLSFIEASYYIYSADFEIIDSQKINSQTGLYVGMPLKALRKWNEADFEFSGFGWDYGGGIMSSKNSKLSKIPFYITLGLTPMQGDVELMGDKMFHTDDPLVKKSKIYIEQFTIHPSN